MNTKLSIKRVIVILLLMIIFLNNFVNISKTYLEIGDSTRLYKDEELLGLVQYKSNGALKQVVRVYYIDPETNERLEAFCIEPEKPGVRNRRRR